MKNQPDKIITGLAKKYGFYKKNTWYGSSINLHLKGRS
jgi:hypothetical protein